MATVRRRDAFRPVRQEIEARPQRKTRLEVKPAKPPLGAPGTITVFVGKRGSPAMNRAKSAINEGGRPAETLQKRLLSQYANQGERMSRAELVKQMVREPVLGEIRYGGTTLTNGIFVPEGVDVAVIVLPYNGGRLAPKAFEFIEHHRPDSDFELEAVVVRKMPELTRAERAALRLASPDQLGKNVGHAIDCDTTWWAVALVTVGTGLAAAAGALAVVTAFTASYVGDQPHLDESTIAELGPNASARRLLALRREYLLKPRRT